MRKYLLYFKCYRSKHYIVLVIRGTLSLGGSTYFQQGAHVKLTITHFSSMIETDTRAHIDPEMSYFQRI